MYRYPLRKWRKKCGEDWLANLLGQQLRGGKPPFNVKVELSARGGLQTSPDASTSVAGQNVASH